VRLNFEINAVVSIIVKSMFLLRADSLLVTCKENINFSGCSFVVARSTERWQNRPGRFRNRFEEGAYPPH